MRYIADLHEFEMVDDVYYCKCAEVCTAKNGNIYTKLDLVDKSGIIKGFKWNSNNTLAADVQKQYVRIKGTVGRYKDDLNLTVNAITIAKDSEFSPDDYVAQTRWDKVAGFDRLDVDYDVYCDGELLESNKNCVVTLGSEGLGKIFDKLIGSTPGDTVEIASTMPDDWESSTV